MADQQHLYASKLIMRPEHVAEEHLCPYLAQMDCQYDGARQQASG